MQQTKSYKIISYNTFQKSSQTILSSVYMGKHFNKVILKRHACLHVQFTVGYREIDTTLLLSAQVEPTTLHVFTYVYVWALLYYEKCTLCFFAKSCARTPHPVSFTASTTVCHVRGRVPVPVSLAVHLLTSSSIQSAGIPLLSISMAFKIELSTPRQMPKRSHFASKWYLRALRIPAYNIQACMYVLVITPP